MAVPRILQASDLCGDAVMALSVLTEMKQRGIKVTESNYLSAIVALGKAGNIYKTQSLLREMETDGVLRYTPTCQVMVLLCHLMKGYNLY